jgi:CHAD domain-containing protein
MLIDPQTKAMKAEFKWIAGELGPARELDVFFRQVAEPVMEQKPNGPGALILTRGLRTRRSQAFARARVAIDSARFRYALLDATAWIEVGEWTQNSDDTAVAQRNRPIASLAEEAMRRHRKKIVKQGARLAKLDAQHRHKLRIRAKKLRYASEFFADVFPDARSSKRHEKFVAGLQALQETLGDLNDIAVHENLAAGIIEEQRPTLEDRRSLAKKAFAAGRLSGREGARFPQVVKKAKRAHRLFANAKPFWS